MALQSKPKENSANVAVYDGGVVVCCDRGISICELVRGGWITKVKGGWGSGHLYTYGS